MLRYRIALIAAVLACAASAATAQELPAGEGHDIVQSQCTMCHGVDNIVQTRRTPEEWNAVVSQMVGNGANLTDEQFAIVVKYLSANLAPANAASAFKPVASTAPATSAAH